MFQQTGGGFRKDEKFSKTARSTMEQQVLKSVVGLLIAQSFPLTSFVLLTQNDNVLINQR
jgi:hypothetical protein